MSDTGVHTVYIMGFWLMVLWNGVELSRFMSYRPFGGESRLLKFFWGEKKARSLCPRTAYNLILCMFYSFSLFLARLFRFLFCFSFCVSFPQHNIIATGPVKNPRQLTRFSRTGDPRGFNKGRSSKFREGFRVRQTPEEGWRTYRPERCGNNNKR